MSNETVDPLYEEAVEYAKTLKSVNVSAIQRKFRLGYNRGARIVEAMESNNIIGPYEANKGRPVLVK